jgi:predicted RND superfamily exporter protein
MTESPMPQRGTDPHRLALGIERLGLIPLAFPLLAGLLVVAISIAAVFGVARIKVDDSLSQLFRSDTAEYRQFESLSSRFPSSEFDVLIVVEGEGLMQRASVEQLRELLIELHFVDGIEGLISMFSAREPPEEGGLPAPLFPDELPQGAQYEQLVERVQQNEIVRGKLLSEDGRLALIVASLDRDTVESTSLREVVGDIRATVDQYLQGSGLTAQLSGAPVMQLEIRNAVERDRIIYNSFGFLAGCLIAAFFFGRLSFIVVAAAPPLLAILWSLGILGWLDFRLNMFLNVMTPLVMVMGFSDSMQLTYAARERLLAGDGKLAAWRHAILVVGPACVLTSVAVALSFAALLLSESHLIRTFGAAGAISAAVAFLAVIVVQPLAAVLLVRQKKVVPEGRKRGDGAIEALRRLCGRLADMMIRRPVAYSAVSLIVVAGLTLIYASLEPRYRLADQVPDREQAVEGIEKLDAKLSGANPLHVLIEFPPGASLYSPETLAVIAGAHAVVEGEAGVGNVWSVHTLRRWLEEEAGITDIAVVQDYVGMLPEHLTRRFISTEEDAVVVTGRIPDADASQLLPVVKRLDEGLADLRASHPGYTISVTGLSAIAARNSASMIQNLSLSLAGEMVVVTILLGLAFRSAFVSLIAIMPGLFPIVISGAVLWWLDEGLQFASIVALTVAFGLGLSATIHYLNRLHLETRGGESPGLLPAVRRATVLVGPALILTTLVLAFGLSVTIFSDLPSLRLFGWLSGFTLMAALVGDLLILPATAVAFRMGLARLRGRARAAEAAE